jgi:hypothetical protein
MTVPLFVSVATSDLLRSQFAVRQVTT